VNVRLSLQHYDNAARQNVRRRAHNRVRCLVEAVQEACARWYAMTGQQQQAIGNPAAWLTKVTSRICLNLLGSARARRETYTGTWLPEPLPDPAEWPAGPPGAAADVPPTQLPT
jgi:DNA-directed RNA polymerase specialized sigma24 family protein